MHFLGVVKLHCQKLHKIICSWYTSRVFWNPAAFSFPMTLPEKKNLQFLVPGISLFLKSLCSEIFLKSTFFWKSYYGCHNSKMMILFGPIHIFVLPIQQVFQKKNFAAVANFWRLMLRNSPDTRVWVSKMECIFLKDGCPSIIRPLQLQLWPTTPSWLLPEGRYRCLNRERGKTEEQRTT